MTWRLCLAVLIGFTVVVSVSGQCVDDDPNLVPWYPTSDDNVDIVIDNEQLLLSTNFLRVRSITIQNGGRLVVSDKIGASVRIEIKYMLITSDGEFHVGSESCRFQSLLDIMLYGRSDDTDFPEFIPFGRKFIAVTPSGTISIHGASKLSWTELTTTLVAGTNNQIIDLADDAVGWVPGDQVVIASSDYDMNHAEVFTLAQCSTCGSRQVDLTGKATYTHLGEVSPQGVDMRAEVGMLTRNIRIFGQMESACYGNNFCQFFNYDTYGGHIQVMANFKKAQFEGIELFNMGQQVLGRYPIHYHVVGKVYGSFARQLSIHNCFSRCVTLHGSEGLTVQDVVGYDTLGHCFFLEDGNEQNNQLIHNLGLVTKPGTLLPSDRDQAMCEGLLDNVYPGYVPNAEKECMEVATFWIAHPNNTIRNNSAAGSVNNGFHFMFHREPTGPSAGTLPPYHGERSHIPLFAGNRAHSNADTGLLLDRGVKVEQATENDPSEFLSMSDYARYMPHYNQDLLSPRYPSYIIEQTAYKNSIGIVVRGGDIFIQKSKLSDNDVGVIMLSDGLLPDDAGSHQELTDSVVAATTDYNDVEWQQRPHPSVGIQLVSGPLLVERNYFYGFTPMGGREAYALGFYPQYSGQFCTRTTIGTNSASETTMRVYFGRKDTNSIYGSYDDDGDLNQIFYDRDGVMTGWPGAYAMRRDNLLLRGDSCSESGTANAAYCIGNDYGQLFVNVSSKTTRMTIQNREWPEYPVTLNGANKDETVRYPTTTQFQSAVVVGKSYVISFDEPTPSLMQLLSPHFPKNGQIKLAIDYSNSNSSASKLSLTYILWKQMEGLIVTSWPLTQGLTEQAVDDDSAGFTYYFDPEARLLHLKLMNRYEVNGYDFCAAEGCQIIRITELYHDSDDV